MVAACKQCFCLIMSTVLALCPASDSSVPVGGFLVLLQQVV